MLELISGLIDLVIAFGVPDGQKYRVAKILYKAFENEFKNIFGSEERSIHVISKHLRNDRTIVAIHEGIVVGVGGLKFEGKEFIDMSFWQALRELGFGIFRVVFLGWIFFKEAREKEVLIDTLAVEENMRSKGIGRKIVEFIIDFAHSRGYKQVKLYVKDINKKAKQLYERIGFKEVKIHKIIFPWNKIFSFDKASEMVYVINKNNNLLIARTL